MRSRQVNEAVETEAAEAGIVILATATLGEIVSTGEAVQTSTIALTSIVVVVVPEPAVVTIRQTFHRSSGNSSSSIA